ncbi:MAG: trypsin-like peptidase domain-containing protein [Pseudomonadota bacterium]
MASKVNAQTQPAQRVAPCKAPAPVCKAADAVFAISSFDPFGSAVRIAPKLLVTNRHLIADARTAKIAIGQGRKITADVIATAYRNDVVLLYAPDLPPGPVLRPGFGSPVGGIYTVGASLSRPPVVTVYERGRLLAMAKRSLPSSRLHHTALTQRGNSGGAVVDARGRLIGIAASGGEGRYEAIPAAALTRLLQRSGPNQAAAHQQIGVAYRQCFEALEQFRPRQLLREPRNRMPTLMRACLATGDRQLYDLAAQALGRVRIFRYAIDLYERSVALDPGSLNARLGLAITLVFARQAERARPHVSTLLTAIPQEPRVQRLAVQVGKVTQDEALIAQALGAIKTYNPGGMAAARRFLAAPLRSQRRRPEHPLKRLRPRPPPQSRPATPLAPRRP